MLEMILSCRLARIMLAVVAIPVAINRCMRGFPAAVKRWYGRRQLCQS
jgi:hypothetical protein